MHGEFQWGVAFKCDIDIFRYSCKPNSSVVFVVIREIPETTLFGGGGPLDYWRGLFEINIFVGKMSEINKWPQGYADIQPIFR